MIENWDMKWHRRFLDLAEHIAQWSKDPSTKVGAVIVDRDKRVVSTGYNGFPRGVDDTLPRYETRDVKYKMICHSERNAILFARQPLHGCVLYTTFTPCAACAGMIIQSGLTHVFAFEPSEVLRERWKDDLQIAAAMFREAGVMLLHV